jgi:prepilin-type processing-associated H-X9-DG protein
MIDNAGAVLGNGNPGGWLGGNNLSMTANDTARTITAGMTWSNAGNANLMSVRYPVGMNNRQLNVPVGTATNSDWNTGTGVGARGANNPLLAAHPAGAMVGYLDGHVALLTKQTAQHVLNRLAIRDDGGVLPDF